MGDVSVTRRYYACTGCEITSTPWDEWAGLGDDHLTPHTRRMAVLAGTSWSFDVGSQRLEELCRVRISDAVIRKVTNAAGQQAAEWQTKKAAAATVRKAEGNAEFYTDGAHVNTREGWREIRMGVFAARKAVPARRDQPAEWKTRALPKPTARMAVAGLQTAEEFGQRWPGWIQALGWDDGRAVAALGDGAKWIWKQVAAQLPRGECVVDVYHVSEHIHGCGKILYGEKNPQARQWADERLSSLIEHGPIRFLESLEQEQAAVAGRSRNAQAQRAALTALADYLKPNVDGLWYASRLARGLPIGSGLIEGTCKTIVGRRLKLNSARWLASRAENVATLCCLLYGEQWEPFWDRAAA